MIIGVACTLVRKHRAGKPRTSDLTACLLVRPAMRTRRSIRWMCQVLAVATLSACGLFGPESSGVVIVTDVASANQPTRFTVRNGGSHVVFVSRCGDHVRPAVDRLGDDGWLNAMGSACQDNVSQAPLALGPGEARVDSVTISQPGTYRLRVALTRESVNAPSLSVVSPRFVVR